MIFSKLIDSYQRILFNPSYLILFMAILGYHHVYSQTHKKVSHLHGTRTINGIGVKVKCIGAVDSLDYCNGEASPYFIGYDPLTSGSGNGRVIFHFSKPVTDVVLNIAGTSDIDGHYEEVIIYVNGKHHKLHSVGKKNACEELALINKNGNIVGCKDCSVSGWNGTKIKGPINSIMIIDTIISGDPNGSVVSLFIGSEYIELDSMKVEPIINTLVNYTYHFGEGSAGKELVVESNQLENTEIFLTDHLGNFIPLHYMLIEQNRIIIDILDIPKGEYLLAFKLNGLTEKQRVLIE